MNEDHKNQSTFRWSHILVALLIFALAIVLVFFVLDLRNLYTTGAGSFAVSRIHKQSRTQPAVTPQQIEGWMTFRYINFVFQMPVNYLKTKLKVTGSAYPNITLNKYANSKKLNSATFTASVKKAVAEYQTGGNK